MISVFRGALSTKFLVITSVLLSCWACTSPDSESEAKSDEDTVVEEAPAVQRLDISEEVFDLSIALPQDYALDNPPRVTFNPAFGHIEVNCGELFGLTITEDSGDIQRVIDELENDLVFEYEIEEQLEQGLLYKQTLPGSDREFWHFYVVRDAQSDELNAHQSRKIFDALIYGSKNYNGETIS